MLKSLASMGTAAKKSLSQLAVRFSQQGRRSEGGNPKEFQQLVESSNDVSCFLYSIPFSSILTHEQYQDEEEDANSTEVLFQNHRTKPGRGHMLQGEDEDNDTFNSENPLIKANSSDTNNVSLTSTPKKKSQ